MHPILDEYVRRALAAFSHQNPVEAATCISMRDAHVNRIAPLLDSEPYLLNAFRGRPDGQVLAAHIRVIAAAGARQFVEAFNAQRELFEALCSALEQEPGNNWRLRVIEVSIIDLRLLGSQADDEILRTDGDPHCLQDTMEMIVKTFGVFASDRGTEGPRSKLLGVMFLVNHLVAIGFRLNNFAFLNSLARTLNNIDCKFSKAHRVTNDYQMGRRAFFGGDFAAARELLSKSLAHCHVSSQRNKRLILVYLIPVNMLAGKLPHTSLLEQYDLMQFAGIIKALKEGNLSGFKAELHAHRSFFIQWGIILALEKLRMILYRNLFRRVWEFVGKTNIPLQYFQAALQVSKGDGQEVEMEEVECIAANLIRLKYMRGFVHHEKQVTVHPPSEVFPQISKD